MRTVVLTLLLLAVPARALAQSGSLLISTSPDNNGPAVREISLAGQDLGIFSSTGLSGALGLALDRAGNVYAANVGDGTIHQFSATGADRGVFATVREPIALTFDPAGNLFVSDIFDNTIHKFSSTGEDLGAIASLLGFGCPGDLVVAPSGHLLVADPCSSVVRDYLTTGEAIGVFASAGLSHPLGIGLNAAGHVFVSNSAGAFENTIHEFSASGDDLGVFASTGMGFPARLVVDRHGAVYVANMDQLPDGNFSIRKFSPAGEDLGNFAILPTVPLALVVSFSGYAGTPGTSDCYAASVSALVDEFGSRQAAASALQFDTVAELRQSIRSFCEVLVVDLEPLPGGASSSAIAINEHGQVAGTSGHADGFTHAVLWDHGTITDLGILPGGTRTVATAINDRGQVAGYGDTASGQQHAFFWDNGTLIDLGALEPGGSGVARNLNDSGQVVGEGETAATGTTHGTIWQNGSVIDLGAGSAFSNNKRGQVVGYTVPGGAFVWSRGTTTKLGFLPGGTFSIANDINNRGDVVGWSLVTSSSSHAFIWRRRAMTDVGTLPGGTNSVANAVNDRAQVVGVSNTASGQGRGFIWDNGEMTAIEPLPGDTGSEAVAVNRRAQVLAFSYSSSGSALMLWQDGATIDLAIGQNPLPNTMLGALNNRGEVVGQHLTESGAVHGALWTTRRFRDER